MTETRKPDILIVEDDATLCGMLAAYFDVQGYHSTCLAWGGEAIQRASQMLPDLIILDIHLPDIDGFEVCARLRQSHRTRNIPILFLTEMSSQADKRHGLEMGVIDYITKPFDVQELLLRVRNILRRATSTGIENPVTGLPEGDAVDEALDRVVAGDWQDRAVVSLALRGLETFRELYGFVASDDVLRVSALTISRAVLETGGPESFAGHLSDHTLVIILPSSHISAFEHRIQTRLAQSLDYFYPGDNRGVKASTSDRLRLDWGEAAISRAWASRDDLRRHLLNIPDAVLAS